MDENEDFQQDNQEWNTNDLNGYDSGWNNTPFSGDPFPTLEKGYDNWDKRSSIDDFDDDSIINPARARNDNLSLED